jgi:hypothetical protein
MIMSLPEGPGGVRNPQYTEETIKIASGAERILKIIDPTIAVYLPPRRRQTARRCRLPGGGMRAPAMDHEGTAIAAWLNDADHASC